MEPLPLDGRAPDAAHCALGGYQSWVRAHGGAVGDRLVVIGNLHLVGKLADGTVMCDGQSLPYVWTSDDDGHTWDVSRSAAISSIAWSGDRFVGWSRRGDSPVEVEPAAHLVESADGIDWVTVAATPPLPEGSFISTSAVTAAGDTLRGRQSPAGPRSSPSPTMSPTPSSYGPFSTWPTTWTSIECSPR